MDSLKSQAVLVSSQFQDQSLNFVVAGFSFASAIAWMDAVRWLISTIIKVPKNGGLYFILTAVLTTLLAIMVYLGLAQLSPSVRPPQQPVFAVTK